MHDSLLDLLRCPFCGTALDLVDNDALVREGPIIPWAVLGCQCCAFPVIDGIPVLIADEPTRRAMHAMEAGRRDEALAQLLGLDASGAARLQTLLGREPAPTYREALEIISPDAEGTYFVYRFSDPTFVLAESLVRAIGSDRRRSARAIDLCGGSGHLTRILAEVSDQPVVVADVYYWKLWLARRFTAPGCAPVCCDANNPLPFRAETFSLVVLSDAFPYIWHKRLLADEMARLAPAGGTILMPHLHSSLGFNFSAGMTLTPAAYRDLFASRRPRLYRDSDLLSDVLGHAGLNLGRDVTPEQAADEPSVTLVASGDPSVFQTHLPADPRAITGELRVNPLYRVDQTGASARLTLDFPTPEYEEEFGGVRRYLPDVVTLDADARGPLDPAQFGSDYLDLRRRRILIDAPSRYY
jgi:uncharacterized protein YbaR (Trm112 family)/SAM-dependent methyltransferase